jgi:hypothetical protein
MRLPVDNAGLGHSALQHWPGGGPNSSFSFPTRIPRPCRIRPLDRLFRAESTAQVVSLGFTESI